MYNEILGFVMRGKWKCLEICDGREMKMKMRVICYASRFSSTENEIDRERRTALFFQITTKQKTFSIFRTIK
jgi:hypothetical protein